MSRWRVWAHTREQHASDRRLAGSRKIRVATSHHMSSSRLAPAGVGRAPLNAAMAVVTLDYVAGAATAQR